MIGCTGFIGSRLMRLSGAEGACRGNPIYHSYHVVDLINPVDLPDADIVYLCAGVNGQPRCEGNPVAYKTNVDGTIGITRSYVNRGSFVVWISSSTVQWANSQYSRMKALVETVFITMPNVGIVRAGRVLDSNVNDLCKTMIQVGRGRVQGLTCWGDELEYR